jgi:hypothetical protein
MKTEHGREWFDGDDPNNFAAAAKKAVENAEDEFRRRDKEFPKLYDVQLQVEAEGPLSGYRVWISPGG